jgi:hypothetical protein
MVPVLRCRHPAVDLASPRSQAAQPAPGPAFAGAPIDYATIGSTELICLSALSAKVLREWRMPGTR